MILRKFAAKVTAITSCVVVNAANPLAASANNFVMVAGRTNDGSRLSFSPKSVHVTVGSQTYQDFHRFFNYAVHRQDGAISFQADAYTPWCRNGKVELDWRAVDKVYFHNMKIYNNIDISKTPWWMTSDGRRVEATSPASRNLLRAVCNTQI
jgi:hypothetical protein